MMEMTEAIPLLLKSLAGKQGTTLIVKAQRIDIGTAESGARLFLEWSATATAWILVAATSDKEHVFHIDKDSETALCLLSDIVSQREAGHAEFDVDKWFLEWDECGTYLLDLGPWQTEEEEDDEPNSD